MENYFYKYSKVLEKVAEDNYSAPVIAHEYGHVKDLEGSNIRLGRIIDTAGQLLSPLGAAAGAIRNNPLLAATPLIGHLPHLMKEYKASKYGLEALEKMDIYSEEEMRKSKRLLSLAFLTHASTPVAWALGGVAAAMVPDDSAKAVVGLAAGLIPLIAAKGALKSLDKEIPDGPLITKKHVETVKDIMELKNRLTLFKTRETFRNTEVPIKPLHAFMYLPDSPGPKKEVNPYFEHMLGAYLKNKKDIKEIIEKGGVVAAPVR